MTELEWSDSDTFSKIGSNVDTEWIAFSLDVTLSSNIVLSCNVKFSWTCFILFECITPFHIVHFFMLFFMASGDFA